MSKYLYGHCNLVIDGKPKEHVHCYLDLQEQRVVCTLELVEAWKNIGQTIERKYEINSLELWGPDSKLLCKKLSVAFAASVGGGVWAIDQTPLRHHLGLSPRTGHLSLVINQPIVFELDTGCHEIMFFPGFETLGPLNIGEEIDLALQLRFLFASFEMCASRFGLVGAAPE